MRTINKFYFFTPFVTVLMSACAPDRNVVSDAERLNIFCSTKKNDQYDPRCQSDEVRLDYRDATMVLVQKLNREVSQQVSLIKRNKAKSSQTAGIAINSQTNAQVVKKYAVNWKTDFTHVQDETTGVDVPVSLSSNTVAKDIGPVDVSAQQIDATTVLQNLLNSFDQLLAVSRQDGKALAQEHGSFVLMNEKNDYSIINVDASKNELELTWAGGGHGIFSKVDARRGKHFFSNDQITEQGHLKIAQSSEGQTQMIEHLRLDWNFAPRKDAVLNYGIESYEKTVSVVEVADGCFRLVGELRMTNTDAGVKKKPLKTFNSKIVLTETEVKIYNGNADGSFKPEPAKTETIPACSDYDGVSVNYGLVI